jgi:BON domain-containing protein
MRQRDFNYGTGERRDQQQYRGDRGRRDRPSRGEETWYREGRWELPADQDVEWYRRSGSERSRDEGPFAGRGPRGYRRSDRAIFEEVCERLTVHGYIDATEIDVEVRQGVVTLTGIAPDRRQKRLAEETIENVAGVQDVQNNLRLAGRGAAETAESDGRKEEPTGRAQTERDQPERVSREQTQTARKEEPEAEDEPRRQEQAAHAEREQVQPVGSASAGAPSAAREEPRQPAEERSAETQRQQAEERKPEATQEHRDERQPVGVMRGPEGDRQPEMTTPRSAAATERSLGASAERPREVSGERPGEMSAKRPGEISGEMPGARPGEISGEMPGARPGESSGSMSGERPSVPAPDRSADRDLDATRIQPATREVQLQAGAPVYSREGEKLGEVAEGSGEFFVVHKGLIFAGELYFPAGSILRSDENGVQLNISKDDLANYKERPTAARTG